MKRRWILLMSLLVGFVCSAVVWAGISEMADLLMKAHLEKQPIPLLSQYDPTLDVRTAYAVQQIYISRRLAHDRIAGFKAGLTSAAAQKKFGVNVPLTGVLLASGQREGAPVIDRPLFKRLMIETEIGLVVGQPITHPLQGISMLQERIGAIAPAIELPDLGFADLKELKAVDIIGANVSVAQFIRGNPQQFKDMDINQITVTLSWEGQVVNHGQGADALGDQWQAALWLVNTVVEQGWQIEPGYILLTGVLGDMVPGKPGKYVADYGRLGKITFAIR